MRSRAMSTKMVHLWQLVTPTQQFTSVWKSDLDIAWLEMGNTHLVTSTWVMLLNQGFLQNYGANPNCGLVAITTAEPVAMRLDPFDILDCNEKGQIGLYNTCHVWAVHGFHDFNLLRRARRPVAWNCGLYRSKVTYFLSLEKMEGCCWCAK